MKTPDTDRVGDPLIIGNQSFQSRLMVGTGKYKSLQETYQSIEASQAEIVTVAVRRLNMEELATPSNLIQGLNWNRVWLLPNTAGARTADEAIRFAFLGKELSQRIGQVTNNFVKLEVISDPKYLLPDPIGTLKAARFLIQKGFAVLPYINADPILAKHLEELGCATVMPLGSPIGSGQGLQNRCNIQIILENAKIPVVIDAGIGKPSDATQAMEMGADAVLVNTAISQADSPILMAVAMRMGVEAGRLGFQARKMQSQPFAQPSSTLQGISL